uniref:Uncharacterized protein n=1 Tax=Arundo donax TaxID=35708 RepID=A0A0A9G4H6_ARUDO
MGAVLDSRDNPPILELEQCLTDMVVVMRNRVVKHGSNKAGRQFVVLKH